MKKEEIDGEKISDKVAVIFDVLLATSTITTALHYGAAAVIPVLNGEEARKVAGDYPNEETLLVGEYEGKTIEGFLDPNPTALKEIVDGKTMILSTTNGTVAIKKSSEAKKIYICTLLNGEAVASQIAAEHQGETIVVVCSGSSNQFCLEDFYGAGHFIDSLVKRITLDLTDSARAALLFYQSHRETGEDLLSLSRVGQMLTSYGFSEEVSFISQKDRFSIVPYFDGEKVLI